MELNGTILVQAIHFLIVYFVLRRFLFRPVINLIMQERTHVRQLHDSIEKRQQVIHRMESEKSEQWEKYREAFAKQAPHIVQAVSRVLPDGLQVQGEQVEVTAVELEKTATDLCKRIDHVAQ